MVYTAEEYKSALYHLVFALDEPKLQPKILSLLRDSKTMNTIMEAYKKVTMPK